jgi:uncharacterized protein
MTVISIPTALQNPAQPHRTNARRRSINFLRWLRKIHLYVGLWGAALGLLFGATGILLNHRSILKIPIEKTVQKTAQLVVPAAELERLKTSEDMAKWLQTTLNFEGLQTRTKADSAKKIIWADREIEQPARWSFNFNSPDKGVAAEYFVGNRFIKIDTQDATPIGTLTRMHMAVGVNVFWVLLSDTIAGGMIVLSITGLLLWTRMHVIKLSAVGVSVAALTGAIWFFWASL